MEPEIVAQPEEEEQPLMSSDEIPLPEGDIPSDIVADGDDGLSHRY